MFALLAAATIATAPPPPQRCESVNKTAAQTPRIVGSRKLGQEPPARGYKTVLRKRDGCVTPVTFPIAPRQ